MTTMEQIKKETTSLIDFVNMNIFERMAKVSEEIQTVAKNLSVSTGKSSYKAVGEVDIINAVKPLEAKYHIYSYPVKREVIDSGIMENQSIDYTTKQPVIKKNLYMRVETTYRFVNIDNPSEFIDLVSFGDGTDTQDKAPGKAMTYSDKYALMKAYKIATGDDPDQDPSGELKGNTKTVPVKQTTASKRTDLIKGCLNYRTQLEKVGVDAFSGAVITWIKEHSKKGIDHMNIEALTDEQISELTNLYAALYNSKVQKNEK